MILQRVQNQGQARAGQFDLSATSMPFAKAKRCTLKRVGDRPAGGIAVGFPYGIVGVEGDRILSRLTGACPTAEERACGIRGWSTDRLADNSDMDPASGTDSDEPPLSQPRALEEIEWLTVRFGPPFVRIRGHPQTR